MIQLVDTALQARRRAHAPYSGFAVGAALLTKSKKIFTGCNVENLSLGLTMCAERSAVAAAVANGEKEFIAIAVVADSAEPPLPCGACRQVLAEFNPDLKIIASTAGRIVEELILSDLLPRPKQGILEAFKDV
ncbi:MAG TPA: cytidine deaminase [Chthoniobacterales bacterium]